LDPSNPLLLFRGLVPRKGIDFCDDRTILTAHSPDDEPPPK